MNVLSLFDGISCGQQALKNLNIKVDNFYSSEINKNSIKITTKNFPDTIHLGDITKIKGNDLPQIDLLIGGSPCQSFSNLGDSSGFDGKSGLFFEYLRLLREVKPKYFLLENVSMKKEWKDKISKLLGVEPIKINSRLVSAQNRNRLYWTNIPVEGLPKDEGVLLKDILEPEDGTVTFKYLNEKNIKTMSGFFCGRQRWDKFPNPLNGKAGCLVVSSVEIPGGVIDYRNENKPSRFFTVNEVEKLQTLPVNYTLCEGISDTNRKRIIANGWTVKVIEHIFKFIDVVNIKK